MTGNLDGIARFVIIAGLGLAFFGVVLLLVGRLPFVGRLPGDIVIRKGNFTIFFPLVTFLLLSLVLTIVVNVIIRLMRK